jgi:asparagine synthase (glutamine-hydrolysing)
MSAILGIYYLNHQPVDPTDLGRMADILAHRGLDNSGIWSEGSVGFGHRMLWTTPESLLEKLPLVNSRGDLAITADARLDNRDELIAALGFCHHPQEKITDSQLVLAAYEKWGESCLEHFLGDFAFAIWDQRQQKLFCARDHMGVKPFYYYCSNSVVVFATEVKAILCLPEIPRRLNEIRVADHLIGSLEDKSSTFYQDILRLPAGHSFTISPKGNKLQSYWSVNLKHELHLGSSEEYVEAFRDIFTEAVRCRLRSAFPVGTMLSGGLDSSSIACVARNLLIEAGNQPLSTFSAIFPSLAAVDPRIDERPYMEAVVNMGGVDAYYVHADQISPLVARNQVSWHLDGACLAPNLYMDWAIFQAAHQQGVRILFSGVDGDTTVSYGHEYLSVLAQTGRWQKLIAEARGLSREFYDSAVSPRRLIWEYGFKPIIPQSILQLSDKLRGRGQSLWPDSRLIHPDFAKRIGLVEHTQELMANGINLARTAKQEHWYALTSGLMQYSLQTLGELAGAFSLELHYPFCDRRLVEFCLALPPEQKLHQGWTRSILRRAMNGILPPEVQWRKGKGNLSANFKQRLKEDEQETLKAVILNNSPLIEDYVNIPALRAAYQRYTSQPLHREADAFNIFMAVTLALWLKQTNLDV